MRLHILLGFQSGTERDQENTQASSYLLREAALWIRAQGFGFRICWGALGVRISGPCNPNPFLFLGFRFAARFFLGLWDSGR